MIPIIIDHIRFLPRSTIVCLFVIVILIFAVIVFLDSYYSLLKSYIGNMEFLYLTLQYVLIYDNSTQWQNALNTVNQTLNDYGIIT